MRFIGDFEDIGTYTGLYTIVASPRHSSLKNPSPIRFVVDTGTPHTIIGARDAVISGIAHSDGLEPSLFQSQVPGIGGLLETLALRDCRLYFMDSDSNKFYPQDLEIVLVLSPSGKENTDNIWSVPSRLGIDVLRNYKIGFTTMSVILEI